MSRLANLLVASDDPDRLSRFVDTLTRNGFAAVVHRNRTRTIAAVAADRPDMVAVDTASTAFDGFALATELRQQTATTGTAIVAVASKAGNDLFDRAESAGFQDVFFGARPEEELMARLRPLLRLATMQGELERRRALARRFGVVVDTAEPPGDEPAYEILSLGDPGALQGYSPAGARITVASDEFDAERRLQDEASDALVVLTVQLADVAGHLDLCNRIRHNPRLFNLPIVMLSRASALDEPIKAYRHGASRVFITPVDAGEVRFALRALLGRGRRRQRLRRALEETKRAETCEAMTGAYSREFFLAHLDNLIVSARAWNKHLAVAYLDIPDLESIRGRFGPVVAGQLTGQVSQWIAAMTRAEDAVTRFADCAFGVAMPDTPLEDAGGVMRRIAGVIGRTDFAVGDVFEPIHVGLAVGMADLALGDTVETLVARSRAALS